MITTLAEWKRQFRIDGRIVQIWNKREGNVEHVFTITKIQSNGVFAKRQDSDQRGWIPFPKREEIKFTEQGWVRMEGEQELAEYMWWSEK